jgi:hypothetical protein
VAVITATAIESAIITDTTNSIRLLVVFIPIPSFLR